MKKWLRYFCLVLVVAACVVGQIIGREFWPVVLAFSLKYHPLSLWVIGGLFLFSVLPALAFLLISAASVGAALKIEKVKTALRLLCLFSVASTVMMIAGSKGEGVILLMVFVFPFAVVYIASVLGFAATLDANKRG